MHWRKKPPEVVYVPVILNDTRNYIEKWYDHGYVRQVAFMGNNQAYKTEVIERLRLLRTKANNAESCEYLKGVNEGIRLFEQLLVIENLAERKIEELERLNVHKAQEATA